MTPLLITLLVVALAAAVVAVVVARRSDDRLTVARDALVALARTVSDDGGSREHLCAAARGVAEAEVAFLAEPDRRAPELVVSAAAGAAVIGERVALDPTASPLAWVFLGDESLHVDDAQREPTLPASRALAGVRGVHLLPVRRGDRVVGVLAIGWAREAAALPSDRADVVALLADEAARAIERDARFRLLSRQARTDELTALPNRRAWDEALRLELSRAQRTEGPLCLALLDLDHFKAFNDAHGHQAGDGHLRRTAAAWRRELRTIDVLARYGGEEFGVLLPSTSLREAREAIERVRAATPDEETASAGVVQWDRRESADELLSRADAALYRAKAGGRASTVHL